MFTKIVVLAVSLCIAQACVPSNKAYSKECIQCDQCTSDIKQAKQIFQNYSIIAHNTIEELKDLMKPEMQAIINNLNEDIAGGPEECKKYAVTDCSSYVIQIMKNCMGVVDYANKLPMSDELMAYQIRIENDETLTEEELSNYCTFYVANTNMMCSILHDNLDAVMECDIEEAVDKTFREPWLNCLVLYSDN